MRHVFFHILKHDRHDYHPHTPIICAMDVRRRNVTNASTPGPHHRARLPR